MGPDQLKEYVHSQDLSPFLERDRRNKGFICPVCGNGSGSSGDGLSRVPLSNSYKCFKCGETGDAFHFIGIKFGAEGFMEQMKTAAQLYGVPFDPDEGNGHRSGKKVQGADPLPDTDISAYLGRCAAAASETDYFARRGLSPETVSRFGLGYDPKFSEGTGKYSWKAVIIPTSPSSYEARNTAVEPNSKEKAGFKCRKHGRTVIFNGGCIASEKERPVFITEGSLDALSIIQCGGQAAALGGVSNTGLMSALLDRVTPAVPFVLALDNDEAGRAAAVKLASELERRGIPFAEGTDDLLGGYHDPNDRLMNDPGGLAKAVEAVSRRVSAELRSPAEKQREEYLRTSVLYSVGEFREFAAAAASRPVLSTGFYDVDKALGGGIHTGLYVLGAVSSLGKTTFALQIADNIAKNGTDVLFFSLEQSKFELMAKSISRETFEICRKNKLDKRYAQSSLSVLNGREPDVFDPQFEYVTEEAFRRYKSYADRLFIYEGIGNISVAEIKAKLRDHIAYTGRNRPAVFIDYLQILKAPEGDERATDKQITDHNITFLKQLSRDLDIPVFAVSSLNRQNYSEKINMAAFKESGAIEYGSDVLMGLQLKGAGESGFDITAAKAKDPREVELCILKNRNGAVSPKGIELNYYPVFNSFRAMLEVYE